MNRYVTAPDYVSACDLGPATVLINYRTGDVQTLLGRSAQWWAELATSGDTGTPTALDALSAQSLLNQLSAIGLLLSTDKPRPWPTPTAGLPIEPSWGNARGTGRAPAGSARFPPGPARCGRGAGRDTGSDQLRTGFATHGSAHAPTRSGCSTNAPSGHTRPGAADRARRAPDRSAGPGPGGLPRGIRGHRPRARRIRQAGDLVPWRRARSDSPSRMGGGSEPPDRRTCVHPPLHHRPHDSRTHPRR